MPLNTTDISSINVANAVARPNGITVNLNNSNGVLKADVSKSSNWNFTWWYPITKSRFEKNFEHASVTKISSIFNLMSVLFNNLILFSIVNAQNSCASFFRTSIVGLANKETKGSTIRAFGNFSTSALTTGIGSVVLNEGSDVRVRGLWYRERDTLR